MAFEWMKDAANLGAASEKLAGSIGKLGYAAGGVILAGQYVGPYAKTPLNNFSLALAVWATAQVLAFLIRAKSPVLRKK